VRQAYIGPTNVVFLELNEDNSEGDVRPVSIALQHIQALVPRGGLSGGITLVYTSDGVAFAVLETREEILELAQSGVERLRRG
jgi:hypothetical protein